jgi:MoaA/NifB/PqqE/SkfB family radical SAM enzyme
VAPIDSLETLRLLPRKISTGDTRAYTYSVPARFFSRERLPPGEIPGTLLENNLILGPPGMGHARIRKFGGGAFSLWSTPENDSVTLTFSTSDLSDPTKNGRIYTLMNQPIGHHGDWDRWQVRRWQNHSRGQYLLQRGGNRIPPPLMANLGITDICNYRCGICGSQNMATPVNRRHMDIRVFRMVADTLFPLLAVAEFNSRGEPLLHPQIEEILESVRDYSLFFRLQTNGSQFTPSKTRLLSRMNGEVSISIDATGDLFEYARTNGRWHQVDKGVRSFLQMRDRDRLAVYIYPTLTARTIQGARETIQWAMEVGVDRVDFHLYDPIYGGSEQAPSPEDLEDLAKYASQLDDAHPIEIRVNYETVKPGDLPLLPQPLQIRFPNIPRREGIEGAHPTQTCMAPVQLVDVDLDGGICVCCMLQERKLGNALTVEAFADCWFGSEYEAVRRSLARESARPLYDTCIGCVKQYTS